AARRSEEGAVRAGRGRVGPGRQVGRDRHGHVGGGRRGVVAATAGAQDEGTEREDLPHGAHLITRATRPSIRQVWQRRGDEVYFLRRKSWLPGPHDKMRLSASPTWPWQVSRRPI